ncbi:hypothetical protein Tco_1350545 [Tanacetum coccineum]
MFLKTITNTTTTLTHPLLTITSLFQPTTKPTSFPIHHLHQSLSPPPPPVHTTPQTPCPWLTRLGFGTLTPNCTIIPDRLPHLYAQGQDDDFPATASRQFAQFGRWMFLQGKWSWLFNEFRV